MIKRIPVLKMLLAVVLCAFAGWALLCLVYCIPVGRMESHAKNSAYLFEAEYQKTGGYKELTGDRGSTPDYLCDAEILLTAAYDSPHPFWKAALLVELEGVEDHLAHESIVLMASDETDSPERTVADYVRFWEGFLVVIKPLFWLVGYGKIRYFQILLHMAFFAMLMIGLYRHKRELCLPYFFAWVFLNPPVIMLCTFYSCNTLLTMAVMLLILHIYAKRGTDAPADMSFWYLFFTLAGCATIYLDYLSTPLLTLGLPLLLWISLYATGGLRADAGRTIGLSAAWTLGYGGMWAMKWVLVSLFTEKNIFEEVWNQVLIRTNMSGYSYTGVLVSNLLSPGIAVFVWPCVMFALAVGLVAGFRHIRRRIPFLLVACYPFVWYFVLQEHSYIHAHYTYRLLAVTIFAFLAIPCIELYDVRIRKKEETT